MTEEMEAVQAELQRRCASVSDWTHSNIESVFVNMLLDMAKGNLITAHEANELATTSQIVIVHGPDGQTSAFIKLRQTR